MSPKKKALLINYHWRHAVNDQSRFDEVMKEWSSSTDKSVPRRRDADVDAKEGGNDDVVVDAIEADIIHSETTSSAVIGHPPATHGDLTLASFLRQIRRANFQLGRTTTTTNAEECDNDDYLCPVLKLDFKSANALDAGLAGTMIRGGKSKRIGGSLTVPRSLSQMSRNTSPVCQLVSTVACGSTPTYCRDRERSERKCVQNSTPPISCAR